MDDIIEFARQHIIPHWPWFSWFFIAMLFGEVFKRTLWTKYNAVHKAPHWFWWWGRKSMVVHPVMVGVLIGLVWQEPEGGVYGGIASCAYFGLAGGLSVWGFELIKGFLKKKADVELELPGLSSSAPPPPGP